MRTLNGSLANIEQLIDWAVARPMTLRFIELMDTGLNRSFAKTERVLGSEIEPLLAARGLTRTAHLGIRLAGPATDYRHPQLPGGIGLINPLSCSFCSDCNRLRITARGRLKLCLFGDQDLPLDLSSASSVALNVRHFIDRKPERHYLDDGNVGNVQTFRTIGG
jgi:cyclic pyranopterin phosphate synthase